MSLQTAAWLVLAMPLAGTLIIALGNRSVLRGRTAGWVGTAAIALAFVFSLIVFFKLEDLPEEQRVVTSALWDLANVAGVYSDSHPDVVRTRNAIATTPDIPSCNVALSGTAELGVNSIRVTYSGTTCLGPVSGVEVLNKK